MAVQLATLDILTQKGHFEPQIARAIGEAIETEIRGAQIVTLPMLDLRLAELKGGLELKIESARSQLEIRIGQVDVKLAQLESRLFFKMAGFGITSLGILIAVLRLFRSSF